MDDIDDAVKIDFSMELKSKGLNKLVNDLFGSISYPQKQQSYRQRLRDCLRIILINLISTDSYISYKRDKHAKEYKVKKYSAANVCKVIDHLSAHGFVESRPGYFFEYSKACKSSKVRCRERLRQLFYDYGIRQHKIILTPTRELIILRDATKKDVPFIENSFTVKAHDNLVRINEILSAHTINAANGLYMHRKSLHRVFNRDFDHGGRFYGGEWQSNSGNDRLGIRIDKAPVVELDFKALHPTMLYALIGERLDGDPYSLDGYSDEIRKFLKVAMLILINTGDIERARRTIQGMVNTGELKKPSEISDLKALINNFMNKHEAIRDLFDSETGLILQRQDSEICEKVLTQFYAQDIPVLGVHDSFIIASNFEKKLHSKMNEVFYNKFRAICHISKKGRKKT